MAQPQAGQPARGPGAPHTACHRSAAARRLGVLARAHPAALGAQPLQLAGAVGAGAGMGLHLHRPGGSQPVVPPSASTRRVAVVTSALQVAGQPRAQLQPGAVHLVLHLATDQPSALPISPGAQPVVDTRRSSAPPTRSPYAQGWTSACRQHLRCSPIAPARRASAAEARRSTVVSGRPRLSLG
jgi:hypothetical protein